MPRKKGSGKRPPPPKRGRPSSTKATADSAESAPKRAASTVKVTTLGKIAKAVTVIAAVKELVASSLVPTDYCGSVSSLLKWPLFDGINDLPAWFDIDPESGFVQLQSGPLLNTIVDLDKWVPTFHNSPSEKTYRLELAHLSGITDFMVERDKSGLLNTVGKSHFANMNAKYRVGGNHHRVFKALQKAQLAVFIKHQKPPWRCADMVSLRAVMGDAALLQVLAEHAVDFAELLQVFSFSCMSALLQKPEESSSGQSSSGQSSSGQSSSGQPSSGQSSSGQPSPGQWSSGQSSSGQPSSGEASAAPVSPISSASPSADVNVSGADSLNLSAEMASGNAAQRAALLSRQMSGQDDLNESLNQVATELRGIMVPQITQQVSFSSSTGAQGEGQDDASVLPDESDTHAARHEEVVDAGQGLHTGLHSTARQRKIESTRQSSVMLENLVKVIGLAKDSFESISAAEASIKELSAHSAAGAQRLSRLEMHTTWLMEAIHSLLDVAGVQPPPLPPAEGSGGAAAE